MKEFIEKLIERLKEKKETYKEIRKNTYCRRTEMDDCNSCIADEKLQNRLETIDNVIKIVNQLAEEYNNGWILVEERLPENGVRVLTCDNRKNMHVMRHYNFYKYPFNIGPEHEQYYMPKAWMPLPESYKE